MSKCEIGVRNGQLDKNYYDTITVLLTLYKELADSATFSQENLEIAKKKSDKDKEIKEISSHILYIKQEAVDAYKQIKNLDYHNYTVSSYQSVKKELASIESILDKIANYEDVNECLKTMEGLEELSVKVNNTQLVDFIKKVNSEFLKTAQIEKIQIFCLMANNIF